jgi:release factor glutamine methyltransferase
MSEEPEAYREGWVPFLGLKIYLDSRPLIPRPETEWWVEQLVLKNAAPKLSVLDLCAGSGAIGCAVLKQFPTAQVYFGEIDPKHEATIRKNIRENNLDESRAHVCSGDLFAPFSNRTSDVRFDIVAANPPYVPSDRELPKSVTDYEPALALRAGPDGLGVIRRIATELKNHLKPGGQAWIECDSEHAKVARALFERAGFSAKSMSDQYDRPRVIVVS